MSIPLSIARCCYETPETDGCQPKRKTEHCIPHSNEKISASHQCEILVHKCAEGGKTSTEAHSKQCFSRTAHAAPFG